jgi:hypothetical protein
MPRYIKSYENVVSAELCSQIIEKFSGDKRVKPDPQPNYSTRHFVFASDKKDWAPLVRKVTEISNRVTADYFKSLGARIYDWFDDGYVIARYRKGDVCALHDDAQSTQPPCNLLRYATLLIYLNTVDGGETHFPEQKVKVKPEMGKIVMFPAMMTHPHEVFSPKGDRFVMQTWVTDPVMAVFADR